MNIAHGVQFDKALHAYTYNGKSLSGVTGVICNHLGLHFAGAQVEERAAEGTHIHEAVQTWIESGLKTSNHPAVTWIMNELKERWEVNPPLEVYSEVLVTDYDRYASAVDLMVHYKDGWVLYDIKTGRFKPEYLSWQLGVYKYFVEKAGLTVINTECICTRDKMFYVVRPRGSDDVEKLLYGFDK
jgi:hypothetical protein